MTVTPSPQSVVVPVEPTEAMLSAAKPWPKHWPKYEDASESARVAFNVDRAVVKSQWRDMLAAAPAPSSLAGGEVGRILEHLTYENVRHMGRIGGLAVWIDRFKANILAALSPEAPAREGARHGVYVASRASAPERPAMWRRLRDAGHPIISTWIDEAGEGESHDLGDLWGRILREVTSAERLVLYAEAEDFPLKGAYVEVGMALAAGVPVYVVTPGVALDVRSLRPLGSWAKHPLVRFCDTVDEAFNALTPRHEAPAAFHDRFGAPAGPVPPKRPEAPAEGAGEAIEQIIYEAFGLGSHSDAAQDAVRRITEFLRARSSAPEAREGEAVAWQYRRPNGNWGDMGAALISVGGKAVNAPSNYECRPLYTHPAAPSADKLREGDKLTYDMGEGVKLRVTYAGPDEGWAKVTFDADGPDAQAVAVRPSRLSPRQSTTPDVLKGDAK